MIKKIMALPIVFSLMLPVQASSKVKYFKDKGLSIGRGAVVEVVDYDARLGGIYQVFTPKFSGEGYSYTRAKNLSKSIRNFNNRAVKRSPASIVGKKFKLDKNLETLLAPPLWPKKKVKKVKIKK